MPHLRIVGDPVKLAWVAVSLMGNALRYSPPGADIDVTLAGVAGTAELRVQDRGPGLEPEVEARIFDRDGGPGLFLARDSVVGLGQLHEVLRARRRTQGKHHDPALDQRIHQGLWDVIGRRRDDDAPLHLNRS